MTRTWVPLEDMTASAATLNQQHIVAQLGEGSIVLRALLEPCDGAGWRHHPAVRMWRGYEPAFVRYLVLHSAEARRRGYYTVNFDRRFTTAGGAADFFDTNFAVVSAHMPPNLVPASIVMPWWWGGEIHARDRAALVARFPEHYGPIWPDVEPLDEPWWPVPYVEGDHECRSDPARPTRSGTATAPTAGCAPSSTPTPARP